MSDPTSAAWEELEEAFRQRGAELTRLRAQQTVLVEALTKASNKLTFVAIDDADALNAMTILNKALATLDVPDTKEQT